MKLQYGFISDFLPTDVLEALNKRAQGLPPPDGASSVVLAAWVRAVCKSVAIECDELESVVYCNAILTITRDADAVESDFTISEPELVKASGYTQGALRHLRLGHKQKHKLKSGGVYEHNSPPVLEQGTDWGYIDGSVAYHKGVVKKLKERRKRTEARGKKKVEK